MTTQTDLKPCPFCGGQVSIQTQFSKDYWVQCDDLGCGASDGKLYPNEQEAIAAWNRRSECQQASTPVGEVGKVIMFGGDCKEVAWAKGKMPPVGTKLYAAPLPLPAPQSTIPQEWREFVQDCAGTAGGMVNGNNLSRLAYRLLSAESAQPLPQQAAQLIAPTYYVRHPDDTYSAADPQPATVAQQTEQAQLMCESCDDPAYINADGESEPCPSCALANAAAAAPVQAEQQPQCDGVLKPATSTLKVMHRQLHADVVRWLKAARAKGFDTVDDALAALSAAAPVAQDERKLCQFYDVNTLSELVAEQARHIEKLQAKLPATTIRAEQRVREG